MLLYYYTVL